MSNFCDYTFIQIAWKRLKMGISQKPFRKRGYIKFSTQLQFISGDNIKVFAGDINIFLDPHATDVPLLGRDVLDLFVVLLDCKNNQVLLLDEREKYSVITDNWNSKNEIEHVVDYVD